MITGIPGTGFTSWPTYRVVTVCLFVLLLPAFVKWVELTIIVNTILISGLVAVPRPITIGGQGLAAHELLAVLGVLIAFYRFHVDRPRRLPRSPVTLPLTLFLIAIAISFAFRWRAYTLEPRGPFPFRDTYNSVRPLFLYVMYFIFLYGIQTERQLKRILVTVLACSAIVGVLMVVQYFVGPNVKIFFGRVEELQEEGTVVTRSIPPGLQIILIYFPLTVYLAAKAPLRKSMWYILLAMALGLGIFFSLTRNFWITSGLAVIIMAAVVRKAIGSRIILYGLAVIGLALSMSLVLGSKGVLRGQGFAGSMYQRFLSAFNVKTEKTMGGRLKENRQTWNQIKRHWLFGLGAGVPIRYTYGTDYMGQFTIQPRPWIHNSYLEIWALYGLLGIGALLWTEIAFALRCLHIYKRARDEFTRAVGVSFFAGLIGLLIRSWVAMNLTRESYSIIAIVGMWGLLEAVWNVHESKRLAAEAAVPGQNKTCRIAVSQLGSQPAIQRSS